MTDTRRPLRESDLEQYEHNAKEILLDYRAGKPFAEGALAHVATVDIPRLVAEIRALQTLASRPTFKHECNTCVFLGEDIGLDLYFCSLRDSRTLVIRHGDDFSAYSSMSVESVVSLYLAAGIRTSSPLLTAYRRAVALGLIPPATKD